ncbi:MAG: type 4 fimbriae expression regulatory protein PilR [Pseudomonadota bacterium]|jgi:two-component system response regulator PilR (NtrC family)
MIPPTPAATPPSLLVVDDEPDLLTVYELALVREGYDVETAASVSEASEVLAARRFDAVITDLRLPDGSGLDLLHRLEQGGRGERVVVITAYGSAENAVQALKAGAFDYLTKPVDLRQFRAVVASALGRHKPQPGAAVPRGEGGSAHAQAAAPAAPGSPAPAGLLTDEALGLERGAALPATGGAGARRGASPALRRMVGSSAAMQQVRALVDKVSRSMAPVLVQGESGTGKELVAQAIHQASVRASGPFVPVNCGAIPEHLLEAEFFGYRKGAFTGAVEDRAGFFQAARGGTLFLDEIGDLPLAMQSKLLRAVQERAVRPLGSTAELPVDVRLVSATHRNLGAEVAAGRFRQDLFYRLNVIEIRVPALRERLDDLPMLCQTLLVRIAAETGLAGVPRLTAAAQSRLGRHDFAGNVRELENLLHRALALSGDEIIDSADLGLPEQPLHSSGFLPASAVDLDLGRLALRPADQDIGPDAGPDTEPSMARDDDRAADAALRGAALPTDLMAHLDEVERRVLVAALERHRNNRTAAGASLGLTLRQMRYRMARLGIQPGQDSTGGDDGDAAAGR